jgi:hypothetical protein
MTQYPEGYYWIQIGECEPEPALIREGGQVFTTGSSLPFDYDLVRVIRRMEAPTIEPAT